jgi:hypothetical protein
MKSFFQLTIPTNNNGAQGMTVLRRVKKALVSNALHLRARGSKRHPWKPTPESLNKPSSSNLLTARP